MKTLLVLILIILVSSCAHVQPHIQPCLEGDPSGFLSGLWHGWIMPISFIGSLFDKDIAIYAVNNTGSWYILGFVLGAGITGGTVYSSSKSRK